MTGQELYEQYASIAHPVDHLGRRLHWYTLPWQERDAWNSLSNQKDTTFGKLSVGDVFVTEGEGEYVKVSATKAKPVRLGEAFDFPSPSVCGEGQIGHLELEDWLLQ